MERNNFYTDEVLHRPRTITDWNQLDKNVVWAPSDRLREHEHRWSSDIRSLAVQRQVFVSGSIRRCWSMEYVSVLRLERSRCTN